MERIIFYIIYFIFIHLTLFIPGYVFLKKYRIFSAQNELLTFSYALSVILYSIISFAWYVLPINIFIVRLFSVLLVFYSAFYFIKNKYYTNFRFNQSSVLLILFSLITLLYVSLPFSGQYTYISDPIKTNNRNYRVFNVKILNVAHTPANDNYIPFRQAQFFVNKLDINKESFIKEWGVNFFYRTPLMGLVSSYYFILTGTKLPNDYLWTTTSSRFNEAYIEYQIIAQILNSLFIVSTYLFLTKVFNNIVAKVSLLFILFNGFFLYNTFFSWPKLFIAYFILCSWYLIINQKKSLVAGIIFGIAFLAHDLTWIYFAGTAFYLLFSKKINYLIRFSGVYLITIFPWYLISKVFFHQSSLFYVYPFSLNGIPQSPRSAIKQFLNTPIIKILLIKLDSLYFLTVPFNLIYDKVNNLIHRVWVDSIFSIPGGVGLAVFSFSYINLLIKFMQKKLIIISFIIMPLIMSICVIGWPIRIYGGMAALHFSQSIIILLIGFGVELILKIKSKILLVILFIINFIQWLLIAGNGYNFKLLPILSRFVSLISIILIFLVFIYSFIYLLSNTKIYSVKSSR